MSRDAVSLDTPERVRYYTGRTPRIRLLTHPVTRGDLEALRKRLNQEGYDLEFGGHPPSGAVMISSPMEVEEIISDWWAIDVEPNGLTVAVDTRKAPTAVRVSRRP